MSYKRHHRLGPGRVPIRPNKEVTDMELVPWRSFGEPSPLRKEMDRLWNRLLRETPSMGAFTEEWLPSVDISETKDNFVVKAELPGLDAKDVSVSISGDILTIRGEKKKETEDEDEHHHYVERYAGSFQRVFQLPAAVKGDKVEASFDKGVLKVTLPKVEEAKKKEVEVKVK
jgi:HSP20 family protein